MRIRAVEFIDTAFVPLVGAKFSMRTRSSLRPQLPRKRSRDGPDGLANVVHEPLYERAIVAFGHHPDQRLGTRFADHEAAAALKLGFRRGDSLPDAVGLERLRPAVETHVLEQLRKRLELAQKLARGNL